MNPGEEKSEADENFHKKMTRSKTWTHMTLSLPAIRWQTNMTSPMKQCWLLKNTRQDNMILNSSVISLTLSQQIPGKVLKTCLVSWVTEDIVDARAEWRQHHLIIFIKNSSAGVSGWSRWWNVVTSCRVWSCSLLQCCSANSLLQHDSPSYLITRDDSVTESAKLVKIIKNNRHFSPRHRQLNNIYESQDCLGHNTLLTTLQISWICWANIVEEVGCWLKM